MLYYYISTVQKCHFHFLRCTLAVKSIRHGMAFTSSQLSALEEAIALGATTVKYADKEVTYRSLSDMMQLASTIRSQLGQSVTKNRRKLVSYSRGFDAANELG